jgi:hypothetical protein
MKVTVYLFVSLLVLNSCASIQNSSKYELADGKYKVKKEGKKFDCYVQNMPDSIIIYKLPGKTTTSLTPQMEVYLPTKQHFIKSSFDVDIITALLKIRPPAKKALPTQLNANFNGNVYVGLRNDIYQIHYNRNPLDVYQRQVNHFGFSGGVFIGMANTAINPSTTANAISTEYDGLVLQKGVAGIVAVNKLTIGVSIGFDNLLDKNQKDWLYKNKPWFGLMLGLNLN